jgi:hypothetical protein
LAPQYSVALKNLRLYLAQEMLLRLSGCAKNSSCLDFCKAWKKKSFCAVA